MGRSVPGGDIWLKYHTIDRGRASRLVDARTYRPRTAATPNRPGAWLPPGLIASRLPIGKANVHDPMPGSETNYAS